MAVRNNPLDSHMTAFRKRFGQLIWQLRRRIAENVSDVDSYSASVRFAGVPLAPRVPFFAKSLRPIPCAPVSNVYRLSRCYSGREMLPARN
jgi:hypothetical protein